MAHDDREKKILQSTIPRQRHAPENLKQKSDMSLRKLIIRPIHMGLFLLSARTLQFHTKTAKSIMAVHVLPMDYRLCFGRFSQRSVQEVGAGMAKEL